MPTGSSNFQQWNPTAANQETDAQYSVDPQRTGGATNPAIFPSVTANKLLYQQSTFTTAFAQMMANKGFVLSDANLNNLEAVLANVMTTVDMSAYAPLNSPALTGTPTAPTPAAGDNSTHLATTAFLNSYFATIAWVTSYFAQMSWVQANYQPMLGFTPVQQGTGPGQQSDVVSLGWNNAGGAYQLLFSIDGTAQGTLALGIIGRENIAANGFQHLPSGLQLQWGNAIIPTGNGDTVYLPQSFGTGGFQALVNDYSSNCNTVSAQINTINSIKVWAKNTSGAFTSCYVSYLVIGH